MYFYYYLLLVRLFTRRQESNKSMRKFLNMQYAQKHPQVESHNSLHNTGMLQYEVHIR